MTSRWHSWRSVADALSPSSVFRLHSHQLLYSSYHCTQSWHQRLSKGLRVWLKNLNVCQERVIYASVTLWAKFLKESKEKGNEKERNFAHMTLLFIIIIITIYFHLWRITLIQVELKKKRVSKHILEKYSFVCFLLWLEQVVKILNIAVYLLCQFHRAYLPILLSSTVLSLKSPEIGIQL